MTQVIQQAFPDRVRQRFDEFFPSLVGWKADSVLSPMDVWKPESTDLPTTHSIRVQHLDDGEVAPSWGRRAAEALQGFQRIRLGNAARNARQLIVAQARDRRGQITFQVPFLKAKAKKGTQYALQASAHVRTFVLGLLGEESKDVRRRHLSPSPG
jgi:hypothetical protein